MSYETLHKYALNAHPTGSRGLQGSPRVNKAARSDAAFVTRHAFGAICKRHLKITHGESSAQLSNHPKMLSKSFSPRTSSRSDMDVKADKESHGILRIGATRRNILTLQ